MVKQYIVRMLKALRMHVRTGRTWTAWMAMEPQPQPTSNTWSVSLMPAFSIRASSLFSCACFSESPAVDNEMCRCLLSA